jgi:hypothetical protein
VKAAPFRRLSLVFGPVLGAWFSVLSGETVALSNARQLARA